MFKSLVFVVILVSASAARGAPHPALEAAVDAAAAKGFAGEVAVTDRASTVYDRAVSAPGDPHSPGETWRWASVTKQITATLVLQEVAAGRLGLDDTLSARLPAFKGTTAGEITVRMLLQHTSGLPNPDETPAAGAKAFPAFYLRAGMRGDAFEYCAGKPRAAPGGRFSYNNCDFIVLGALLERITGEPYGRIVHERIAAPLQLKTLGLAEDGVEPATVRGRLDDTTPEPAFHLATFGASGALYGDAADLLAFDRALLEGRLLDAAATRLAWTGDPKLGYVALGAWAFPAPLKGCSGAVKLVERRGEIGGIEVRNLIAPELGRALVLFADRSDLDFGEIWQGKGMSYDLASAAFCT